jgi:hypothetical protein
LSTWTKAQRILIRPQSWRLRNRALTRVRSSVSSSVRSIQPDGGA